MAAIFQTTFQTHFLERKLSYFDENFIEMCFPGSNNWRYFIIGSDNGLALGPNELMFDLLILDSCLILWAASFCGKGNGVNESSRV